MAPSKRGGAEQTAAPCHNAKLSTFTTVGRSRVAEILGGFIKFVRGRASPVPWHGPGNKTCWGSVRASDVLFFIHLFLMKLALVGTGQMGQAVATEAADGPHEIVARFDSSRPLLDAAPSSLRDADLAVDFSLPTLALPHFRRYCEWDMPVVMGTTGWYDALAEVEALVDRHDASVLYAPNFSIGVAVFSRAVDHVTRLMDELDAYDAFVHEMHHTKKADSPSGTARMLAEQLLEGLDRKDHLDAEAQHAPIDPSAVHVSSTRAGTTFGEHTVGFDSPYDRLSLNHRAKNRRGFAMGALRGAEWLQGRTGLFTLDDVLDDWLAD